MQTHQMCPMASQKRASISSRLVWLVIVVGAGLVTFTSSKPSIDPGAFEPNPGNLTGEVIGALLIYSGVCSLSRVFHSSDSHYSPTGWVRSDRALDHAKVSFWLLSASVSVLLVALGVGRSLQDTEAGPVELSPGFLTFGMGALAVVSLIVALRMVVRRYCSLGRTQVAWHRWLVMAGPSVSSIAAEWQTLGESGPSVELSSAGRVLVTGGDPSRIGSLHGVTNFAGGIGHPLGLPLTVGLMGAKLAVNWALKTKAEAEAKAEEAAATPEVRRLYLLWTTEQRRLQLLRAKARLKEMLEGYDAARLNRIVRFLPGGRRWLSDRSRTAVLLEAVNDCIQPRAEEVMGEPVDGFPEVYTSFERLGVAASQDVADEVAQRLGVTRQVVALQLAIESERHDDLLTHEIAVKMLTPAIKSHQEQATEKNIEAGRKFGNAIFGTADRLRRIGNPTRELAVQKE
jgi:hypothetical protein